MNRCKIKGYIETAYPRREVVWEEPLKIRRRRELFDLKTSDKNVTLMYNNVTLKKGALL